MDYWKELAEQITGEKFFLQDMVRGSPPQEGTISSGKVEKKVW